MDSERWQQLCAILDTALTLEGSVRKSYLDVACNGDSGLRAEIEHLLENEQKTGLLDEPPPLGPLSNWGDPIAAFPVAGQDLLAPGAVIAGRYRIVEMIGRGGMGEVYRAFDCHSKATVALKKLTNAGPAQILRFKREFRSLADLLHPNLVRLYELSGEAHRWFFTMELIKGEGFLKYVRPNELDWNRLRAALAQLASGIDALHVSAGLHRDLKPSNVLVAADGRVVILDFGLIEHLYTFSPDRSIAIAGSPAYMAPEQFSKNPATAAVDWYAIGVMLYQAITEQLPFAGDFPQIARRKQTEEPPCPQDLVPETPDDLNELCRALLSRTPAQRMEAAVTLRRSVRNFPDRVPDSKRQYASDFVGRRMELALLHQRFSVAVAGQLQVVLVTGKSGMGKSTLLHRFLSEVQNEYPDAVILRGRCHQAESIPYKAFDAVADELTRYLRALPSAHTDALLPRRPALLSRLFPVLGDVEQISASAAPFVPDTEADNFRRQAFEALRELLGRLADRRGVVICIDDLQWSDLDSMALLTSLLLPPNAPPLMLVLAFRSEDRQTSQPLQLLGSFKDERTDPDSWFDLRIGELSEAESRDLVERLLCGLQRLPACQHSTIVAEAHGNPLFLYELVRFANVSHQARPGPEQTGADLTMKGIIRRRIQELPNAARQVLEVLSVAGEPVGRATVFDAVGTADQDPLQLLSFLIHENLIRVTGSSAFGQIEPFHDQIREAAIEFLSAPEVEEWHSRLAQVLAVDPNTNPQKLVRHYRAAKNMGALFRTALQAGNLAEEALAFDRAAQFYSDALDSGLVEPRDEAMLLRKLGDVLAKSGRGHGAAQAYLAAARFPGFNDPFDMRRLAAEQLLRCGRVAEGTETLHALLRGAGIWVPRKPVHSVLAMEAARAVIWLRRLRWREKKESDIHPGVLKRLDLIWSGALVLTAVNPIFAAYLQVRHLLSALDAGEPARLADSIGLAACHAALRGEADYAKALKLLTLSRIMANRLQNHYAIALGYGYWAMVDHMCGRIPDGLEHCRTAITFLRQNCTGVSWETATVQMMFVWFLGWGGRLRELEQVLPALLDDGHSRGDIFAEVSIRCYTTAHLVNLAADKPEKALEEAEQALSHWQKTEYNLQHFGSLFSQVECELYSGRIDRARTLVLQGWKPLMRSLLFRRAKILRVAIFYMRARTALGAWLAHPDDRRLRAETEKYSRRLVRLGSSWGSAISNALEAGLCAGTGRIEIAIQLLERAEAGFREQDLRLLAAAMCRRRGELKASEGSHLVQAADEFMVGEGVVRPDRMVAMVLPGRWR